MSGPEPKSPRPGEKPTLAGALLKMAAVIVGLFAIFFAAEWAAYTAFSFFGG